MILGKFLVLSIAGLCGVAAGLEAGPTVEIIENDISTQDTYGDWINPEDLAPMPQCIAQQDQTRWLNTMTKCTSKICTRHFGVFCTHHQWLTQLSCLSIEFSSDVVEYYLPYCGRSVLAKAQLYQWIHKVTDRTWLVEVGDANGLDNLSPAPLSQGYADVGVVYKAPTCLSRSTSATSQESLSRIMTSCSFKSTSEHTGDSARPWEYYEPSRSIIALDSETVGYYNLTGHRPWPSYGDYFDRECFCSTFSLNQEIEPCSELGQLEITKERLWINATCGPKSMPDKWKDNLMTTEHDYIPITDWKWPKNVAKMPKKIIELKNQCATDACELDSDGYCNGRHAVDRVCFCRNIDYDACGASCGLFEHRTGYVKWLHDLCGDVQDWHGLPEDWSQLATITPLDMIPWQWTLKPSNNSSTEAASCPSNASKIGSIFLVNLTTALAFFLSRSVGLHRVKRNSPWHPKAWHWFSKGLSMAALLTFASLFNAFSVQRTPGYEAVSIIRLLLLWLSMPTMFWLHFPLFAQRSYEELYSAAAASLFAELLLLLPTTLCMVLTIYYGVEHNFYFGTSLFSADRGGSAIMMYIGALLWLSIFTLITFPAIRAVSRVLRTVTLDSLDLVMEQEANKLLWKNAGSSETSPLLVAVERNTQRYGTTKSKTQPEAFLPLTPEQLYKGTRLIALILSLGQWLFWGGFIGLSSDLYCPPNLETLTFVWSLSSVVAVIVGTL